jgi:CDP-6-deoxy-D-xylo-4-hexulose-3-dehydrase
MEGGMVSTNNTELAMVARSMRAHGWTRDKKSGSLSVLPEDHFQSSFEFILPGFCVRPIEFMGAIGSVQLEKWEQMLSARQQNASLFNEIIMPFKGKVITQQTNDCGSSWFGFSIILDGQYRGCRQRLLKVLESQNIEYRPIVAGNFTKQPVVELLNTDKLINYENADHLHDDGLFVGNDSRDLTNELRVLEACLSEFFDD